MIMNVFYGFGSTSLKYLTESFAMLPLLIVLEKLTFLTPNLVLINDNSNYSNYTIIL